MPRWFNVAGPCNEADHYMIPAMRRLPRIRRLIERKSYFVLHAPRQVGKTTALLALGRELTAAGHYLAVLLSVEVGAAFPNDIDAAKEILIRRQSPTASPNSIDTSPASPSTAAGSSCSTAAAQPLAWPTEHPPPRPPRPAADASR